MKKKIKAIEKKATIDWGDFVSQGTWTTFLLFSKCSYWRGALLQDFWVSDSVRVPNFQISARL